MGIYQHGLTSERRDIPDEEAPGAPWYRVADSPPKAKVKEPVRKPAAKKAK